MKLSTGSVVLFAALTTAPIFAHAQEAENIGKVQYETYCATCHGVNGNGDGPTAKWLTKPPADLTQIQKRNGGRFPTKKVFDIIDGRAEVAAHGPREMPVWGKIFKQEDTSVAPCKADECFYSEFWRGRILALIRYIRTLQEGYPPAGGTRDW
jgi:mono/diheme cytochrome c family protein